MKCIELILLLPFGYFYYILGCIFLTFLLLICLRLDIAKNFLPVTNTFNAYWITFISTRLIMFLQFSLLRQELTTSRLAAMDSHMLSFEAPAVNFFFNVLPELYFHK